MPKHILAHKISPSVRRLKYETKAQNLGRWALYLNQAMTAQNLAKAMKFCRLVEIPGAMIAYPEEVA